MSDAWTDEQRLLHDSVSRFLADRYAFEDWRARTAKRRVFDPEVWQGLAEIGVMALPFPEDVGGFGGRAGDIQIIMELFGRHLLREPWLHSVVLAGGALEEVAKPGQMAAIMPRIMSGESRIALAYAEPGSRWNAAAVTTTAEPDQDGYLLNGGKTLVYGAPGAEHLLVTARASAEAGGLSLFLVEAHAPGVSCREYETIDGVASSDITFANVAVKADALIGHAGEALPGIERAVDRAIVAACAEAVGILRALLEKTIEYTKTRVVFGNPLAKQQTTQHRLVDMAVAVEHAAAMTSAATRAIEQNRPRRAQLVAAAKALVGREGRFVGQLAVQLHGGIGYTDELDIGHYFRRLTAFDAQFGNRDHHLRRYWRDRKTSTGSGNSMFALDQLTPEESSFQEDIRAFLRDNTTERRIAARERTTWAFSDFAVGQEWQHILHGRGWGAPHWPREYGGANWSTTQHLIWSLETARARTPLVANMGRDMCAPCIMAFGSDEQKAEFLPKILSGEDCWAQGYSEPGAGSDLANLQLRAATDGDDYILNGSKIWTTFAHHANRIFCLVRTSHEERKQQGITFLLIDLETPGITVRPILNLAGEHDFNQVFFDDVRVPKTRRLGDEGGGWAVARHLLKFEHGGNVAVIFELEERLNRLEVIARDEPDGNGGKLLDDPDFQLRFAEAAVECEAIIAAADRIIDATRDGTPPDSLAELLNVRRREIGQRLTEMLMDALGPYGGVDQASARDLDTSATPVGPEHARMPTALYLAQRAATIAGGAPEIHRNNLARHHLHL